MNLAEFIEKFVCKNTMIQLWYKIDGGHEAVGKVEMEWELVKSKYKVRQVVGVTDILVLDSPYKEAVNIVIER